MTGSLKHAIRSKCLENPSGIDPDIIELIRTKINEWQPDIENIYVTRAGGTISCHCGPGTLGILYMYE